MSHLAVVSMRNQDKNPHQGRTLCQILGCFRVVDPHARLTRA